MNTETTDIERRTESLASVLRRKGWHITAAESCTGGLLAAQFTELAGSSDWFEQSYVCYSNAAKQQMLSVPETELVQYGAVSAQVAKSMASGAQKLSNADVAIAVTGIAGPGGGTSEKPVGTVYIAWKVADTPAEAEHFLFSGNRADVRRATTYSAIAGALQRVT